jgi:hypothetical protein
MIRTALAATAMVATLALGPQALADSATYMPSDAPVDVNGYELACTGIGDEAQSDPRWKAFPVRIEFAGGNAQYLADVEASVFDAAGKELFRVSCDSPWLLAKLPPARYRVQGTFRNLVKAANFVAPTKGQARIIVRFPEVTGNGDN